MGFVWYQDMRCDYFLRGDPEIFAKAKMTINQSKWKNKMLKLFIRKDNWIEEVHVYFCDFIVNLR